jgi:hypothetical protein
MGAHSQDRAHEENLGAHDGIEGAALSGSPELSEGRLLQ